MRFKIPFTISDLEKMKKKQKFFLSRIKPKRVTKLQAYLDGSNINLSREEYLAICLKNFFIVFFIFYVLSTTAFALLRFRFFYLTAVLSALLFSGFVFFLQRNYPRIYSNRREKNIEKNILPALEDILIQLNSGIPLFNILVNISASDYGELSIEFREIVRRINAGESEEEVLDEVGEKSSSVFFRRTLWQISNGMKAGSDMSIVIEENVKSLNEEQLIQIQDYGNKLNPLIMFYMLISVIIPALSITFLTVISSMINLPEKTTMLIFILLFVFVVLIQVTFLGMIKSIRPSLL